MVKLTYCIRRKVGLTPEQFRKHWLEKHAPLVKRNAKALRARRYVQSHTIKSEFDGVLEESRRPAAPFDGITEVWWDSLEDIAAMLATPEGQEAAQELLEDERDFIDFGTSSLFLTEEHEVF